MVNVCIEPNNHNFYGIKHYDEFSDFLDDTTAKNKGVIDAMIDKIIEYTTINYLDRILNINDYTHRLKHYITQSMEYLFIERSISFNDNSINIELYQQTEYNYEVRVYILYFSNYYHKEMYYKKTIKTDLSEIIIHSENNLERQLKEIFQKYE